MGIKSASGKRRRKAVSFNSCHLRVGAKTTNAIYSMKEEEKKNELKISFIEMKRYTKSKRERRAMTRDIFSPHSWHGTHKHTHTVFDIHKFPNNTNLEVFPTPSSQSRTQPDTVHRYIFVCPCH